jgi:UDP-N-acetylmuramoyl-tripeptide--D-alanyl-D-alanine ligase
MTPPTYSIDQVSAIVGGRVIHGELAGTSDGALFFDSRTAKRDGIFLALHGDRVDGHDFAAQSGCAFALVSREIESAAIIVADVLVAAAIWAKYYRSTLTKLKLIGITGSQGKTTTKDMVVHLLSLTEGENSSAVVAPQGSYNNDLGVPVVVTSCDEKTKFCIAEMGARHKGDIFRLASIADPEIGIVLKVGNAHLGEFGSRESIAETKAELVAGIKRDGIAILGTYDEFTPSMADSRPDLKVITFGERGDEEVRATDIEARGGYAHFELVTPRGRETVELRIAGIHNVANALATAAIGYALGIPENEIASALSTFEPQSRWRMELQEVSGVTVINDSYNANPESMKAALETARLLAQESGGRTFVFLGTMNELGDASDVMHQEIGNEAIRLGLDYLIAVGERRYLTGRDGETEEILVDDLEEARRYFDSIAPGDCVLFKASRSVGLERLAEDLIAWLGSRTGRVEESKDLVGNLEADLEADLEEERN